MGELAPPDFSAPFMAHCMPKSQSQECARKKAHAFTGAPPEKHPKPCRRKYAYLVKLLLPA
jgi:hypothetical protein